MTRRTSAYDASSSHVMEMATATGAGIVTRRRSGTRGSAGAASEDRVTGKEYGRADRAAIGVTVDFERETCAAETAAGMGCGTLKNESVVAMGTTNAATSVALHTT